MKPTLIYLFIIFSVCCIYFHDSDGDLGIGTMTSVGEGHPCWKINGQTQAGNSKLMTNYLVFQYYSNNKKWLESYCESIQDSIYKQTIRFNQIMRGSLQ